MSTTTEPQARPDLSALDPALQRRILLAETQGATWVWDDSSRGYAPGWRLYAPDEIGTLLVWFWSGAWLSRRNAPAADVENYRVYALPDYEGDPAAWGALGVKERVVAVPYLNGFVGILCGTVYPSSAYGARGIMLIGPYTAVLSSPGAAVVAAVLAKYGVPLP